MTAVIGQVADSAEVHPRIVESLGAARANQSRVDYGPVHAAFRTEGQADPVAAGLAKLRDPSPDGVQAREALIAAIVYKNTEFNAQGTELNQRYESSAVIHDPDVGEEVWKRDRGLYLQATTRPGAKIPHAWLTDEVGRKISTLDVTQKGKFSLVTGLAGRGLSTDGLQISGTDNATAAGDAEVVLVAVPY